MDFKLDLRIQLINMLKETGIEFNKMNTTMRLLIATLNTSSRLIYPKKRNVCLSNKVRNFIKNSTIDGEVVDYNYVNSLKIIKYDFLNGRDVTKYLSNNIYTSYLFDNEQYSDKKTRKEAKVRKDKSYDKLLSDWGIYHLHISIPKVNEELLLFVKLSNEYVYFIDVKKHITEEFCNIELPEILNREWPDLTKKYRIKGLKLVNPYRNADEIKDYRKHNGFALGEFNGNVFYPLGGGMMSDGSSCLVVQRAESIIEDVNYLQGVWENIIYEKKWSDITRDMKLKFEWLGNKFMITNENTHKGLLYSRESGEVILVDEK